MPPTSQNPVIYLITSGATTARTASANNEFQDVLRLVRAAVNSKIDLIQIREKNLTAASLSKLTTESARITRGSSTRLLVNDRADIAAAAGADGVHLTSRSLPARVVRATFGGEFLIGVSSHSLDEAVAARNDGADFAVFGPVFETVSKLEYGQPQGLGRLASVAQAVSPFPVLALGGVRLDNAAACIRAGASGIAAISLLSDPERLDEVVKTLLRNLRTEP